MWFQILKKDLKKRKSINIILLVFVILSTMFLASSVSNINLVLNGLDNYMKVANVSDLIVVLSVKEKEEFEKWLASRNEVTKYGYEELCEIEQKNVFGIKDGEEKEFEEDGTILLLGHVGGEFTKALDHNGNNLNIKDGQVAVSFVTMNKNKLSAGDELKVLIEGKTYTYTIVECKDILYGNKMLGSNRILFTQADYEKMTGDAQNLKEAQFCLVTSDIKATQKSLDEQSFETIITAFPKNMFSILYVFDMIVAALLIVIGMCLIFISLLILRFSLVFTLEENCQEIGIMKALGMQNFAIRKIYLIKYMAIVIWGASIGFVGSIPVGNMMVTSVSKAMVIGNAASTWVINLGCSLLIVLFVLGMCLVFTRRMKKMTAITAIRNGQIGERYGKRHGLNLYKKNYMGTTGFLGLNDVLCNIKRYLVLLITFCISFVLISIPLNTLTTMKSSEMVKKFAMDPDSAIYINAETTAGYSVAELEERMDVIRTNLQQKGYEAELSTTAWFYQNWTHGDNSFKVISLYPVGEDHTYLQCDKGVTPQLENEVAFSKRIMEEYQLEIGDVIRTVIGGKDKEFIITGYYTDYCQMGRSARFSPAIDMTGEIMSIYWMIMVNMETDLSQEELKETFNREFSEYSWITGQEVVDVNVGGIKDTMSSMQLPMTIMLCLLIMLVGFLMMRLFIVREKGQIAMLKSIGFKNRSIRLWLVARMIWVAAISMVLAVPLSMLSNRFVLTPVFAIMGAELTIQVEPLKAYLIYPGILLIGIIIATVWATGSVKKITTKDMTNAE